MQSNPRVLSTAILVAILTSSSLAIAEATQKNIRCFSLNGELMSWEGAAPNILIRSNSGTYGVPEKQAMLPDWLEEQYPMSKYRTRGQFEVCGLGYSVKKYANEKSIPMVRVQSAQISSYLHYGNDETDNTWHAVQEPNPSFNRDRLKPTR